jgi:hypothetical protein
VAPSGFMSPTTGSRSPQVACSHNRSRDYWKSSPDAWHTRANIDYNAKFGTIFPATGRYAGLADVTLMEVLNPSEAVKEIDHNHVAMQSVVALLNARSASYAGMPSVLPEESVMEIWNEFAVHGYYTPSSRASLWSGPQVAEYLESTFR